jgi:hypothetical protein
MVKNGEKLGGDLQQHESQGLPGWCHYLVLWVKNCLQYGMYQHIVPISSSIKTWIKFAISLLKKFRNILRIFHSPFFFESTFFINWHFVHVGDFFYSRPISKQHFLLSNCLLQSTFFTFHVFLVDFFYFSTFCPSQLFFIFYVLSQSAFDTFDVDSALLLNTVVDF